MHEKPQFKAHFNIHIVEDEKAVFLLSELDCYVLQGRIYCLLAPLLDGKHGIDQIIDHLAGQASIAEIYYALALLEKKAYITEAGGDFPREQLAFWSALGVETPALFEKVKSNPVSVISLGSDSTGTLLSILQEMQLEIAAKAELLIVLVDDYLQPELEELNQKFCREKQSWILVKARGSIPWLGPLFIPGKTACWQCLAQRLQNNRDVEEYIRRQQELQSPVNIPPGTLPATRGLVWNLLAVEVAKQLLNGRSLFSENKMISLDIYNMSIESHALVKRPQCPICGQAADIHKAAQPPLLQSTQKLFTFDGGHRSISPEETLQKYGQHVSSITGVVKFLHNPVEDDSFLKVYHSGHNCAAKYGNLALLRGGLRSQSAGKGMSEMQAKAGALCEAVERYSGVFRGEEARIRASYRELGEEAIHPNRIMNFSSTQYLNRELSNAREGKFNQVPEPFDENQEMDWTAVWSLTREKFRYLPTAFCYFSHPENKTLFSCSNGNASGNILEEAILQGFFELVERDSVAIWWYNRLQMPEVDLASFNEPFIHEMQRYYRRHDREIWVLDLSSDLNIPAFAALTRKSSGAQEAIMMGFGAHFDARLALIRALTELNQMMLFVLELENGKWGEENIIDNATPEWLKQATVANQPYLLPHSGKSVRKAGDYNDLSGEDFLSDIKSCRQIIERKGMEMLVLEQTRPDIGIAVVKVIVPGLRHFWKRLAPGRLYDVPVEMGWLPLPRLESEMNPIGVFL
ncbi:MAG TPA: adenylate cyclase [Syntrophomonas wolfei]|uniref:Adenylate cyclase n=1 Tax=Syntrophomonas wolfei TaxID=863 RepID=A0A354YXK1_9FIRM|nr:adenylate cyclase [Syntrophomonas wolfei]